MSFLGGLRSFSNSIIDGTIRFRYENRTSDFGTNKVLSSNREIDNYNLMVIILLIFVCFLILGLIFGVTCLLKYKINIKNHKRADLFEMNLIFTND